MSSILLEEPIHHEDAKDKTFHEEETEFDSSSRSFAHFVSSWLSGVLNWIEKQ